MLVTTSKNAKLLTSLSDPEILKGPKVVLFSEPTASRRLFDYREVDGVQYLNVKRLLRGLRRYDDRIDALVNALRLLRAELQRHTVVILADRFKDYSARELLLWLGEVYMDKTTYVVDTSILSANAKPNKALPFYKGPIQNALNRGVFYLVWTSQYAKQLAGKSPDYQKVSILPKHVYSPKSVYDRLQRQLRSLHAKSIGKRIALDVNAIPLLSPYTIIKLIQETVPDLEVTLFGVTEAPRLISPLNLPSVVTPIKFASEDVIDALRGGLVDVVIYLDVEGNPANDVISLQTSTNGFQPVTYPLVIDQKASLVETLSALRTQLKDVYALYSKQRFGMNVTLLSGMDMGSLLSTLEEAMPHVDFTLYNVKPEKLL